MGKKGANLRSRRGKRPKDNAETTSNGRDTSINDENSAPQDDDNDIVDDETPWDVLKKHPLIKLLVIFGIPYGLYVGYRWVVLQHPFLATMRSAVGKTDPRQLLIIGSMSSGTSSIANELGSNFMEIGHEDSDTKWKFVRDGTVSWFHGVRYFASESLEERIETITRVCTISYDINSGGFGNYGFGPTLFGDPEYECSFWHPDFKKCYTKSCHKALLREYGCAVEPDGCTPPFERTLLQAREPWKIIASLAAKYCLTTDGKIDDTHYPNSLQRLLHAVGLVSSSSTANNSLHPHVCVNQMMEYVVNYYNRILDNAPPGDVAVYRIEESTPCQIAKLAGLDSPETTIFLTNHQRYESLCSTDAGESSMTKQVTKSKSNVINKGRVSIADLLPYASSEDLQRIKDLYSRLGYQYPESTTTTTTSSQ